MKRNEILDFLARNKLEMRRRFSVKRIGLFASCGPGPA